MTGTRIAADRLHGFVARAFAHVGVPEGDADLLADTLVQADLWGHHSHGVLRAPWYLARLQTGAMRAQTAARPVIDAGALRLLDGDDGIGQVLMAQATDDAVARAKAHGVGVVGVRWSNHFGTAMYYTRRAAEAGCVALLATNASPAMAPWGGRQKTVGTNPWSIAAPGGTCGPLLLDIANTAVARGKIYLAQAKGQAIPPNWALTAEGAPTTDPAEAIAGLILPMAEHKGYAIAVMMDVLAGVLTGGAFGADVVGPYVPDRPSGCGHLMIALDIAAFQPLDIFKARVDALVAGLKAVPLAPGADEILYPGEIEARNDARQRRDGIGLAADTWRDLAAMARQLGIPPPDDGP